MEKKLKFVFFGTGDFAVKILEILIQNNFIPELIITTPDKPKGRKMLLTPPPVKSWSMKHGACNIKFLQPAKLDSSFRFHPPAGGSSFKPDLFIVSDYGKIIPKAILEIPKHGSLNVHPSLLPKFRGPSPIQSFILSGEEKTGAAIILMDEKIDHGPIVSISNLSAKGGSASGGKNQISNLTYKQLEEKLAELGGELLVKTIPEWIEGKIKPAEQNENQATYTKKIIKEDGLIDLEKDPPEIIERKVRAFTPWPSVYFFANGKRIIITEAKLENGKLVIKKIKPEGKNEMGFEDFLKGNKLPFQTTS